MPARSSFVGVWATSQPYHPAPDGRALGFSELICAARSQQESVREYGVRRIILQAAGNGGPPQAAKVGIGCR